MTAATAPVIGSLSGVGGSTVNLGGTTLAINQTGTSTFGGSFVGSNSSDVFLQGGGTEILTGASTTSGSFFIDDGKLSIGPGGSLPSAVGGIAINGGAATFDISNGGNQTILNLGGIGAGSVTLGANTLTIINTQANLLPAIISGTGGLIVDAPSTLTLSGANTYTGPTTVAGGGTLLMGPGGSIASSSGLTLQGGATFDIASAGGGNQTVNNLSGTNAGSQVVLGPFNLTVNSTVSTELRRDDHRGDPDQRADQDGRGDADAQPRRGDLYRPDDDPGGDRRAGCLRFARRVERDQSRRRRRGVRHLQRRVIAISPTCCSTVIQDLVGVAGTTVSLGTTGLTLGTANSTVYAGAFTGSGPLT